MKFSQNNSSLIHKERTVLDGTMHGVYYHEKRLIRGIYIFFSKVPRGEKNYSQSGSEIR